MILPFSTTFKKELPTLGGKDTNFQEKIWSSLYDILDELGIDAEHEFGKYFPNHGTPNGDTIFVNLIEKYTPKIHTIRRDQHQRWKPGSMIHFTVNARTKNHFQFAPLVALKAKQKFEIYWNRNTGDWQHDAMVYVNEYPMTNDQIRELAKNDGFDTVEGFFEWFNEDFDGWILHWTDYLYK